MTPQKRMRERAERIVIEGNEKKWKNGELRDAIQFELESVRAEALEDAAKIAEECYDPSDERGHPCHPEYTAEEIRELKGGWE